jgi:ribosomal protein S18 acetylase RimI-like enzyme
MNDFVIRPLEQNDFPGWLPLWDGNNEGSRNQDVTAETWSRLIDPHSTVNGLCAIQGGKMVGLVHYILHPTTGAIAPVCYMQDLYVPPEQRRQGIARALVEELAKIGRMKKWTRMYWLAETDNEAAQTLYQNLGLKLRFTLHVLPLG